MEKNFMVNMVDRVESFILREDLLTDGDNIVLGFSGGVDSVCLLDILYQIAKKWEKQGRTLSIYLVHINHLIRGAEADSDQYFCEEVAKRYGLECFSYRIDCIGEAKCKKIGIEEAGRNIRYQKFVSVANLLNVDKHRVKIALAHHANDRAETLLFRMLRGVGVDGLSSITSKRIEKDIYIIRPLIDILKSDIMRYCYEKGLSWREDATNIDIKYSRNKIRNELIPYLEKEYAPDIIHTLTRLSQSAEADRRYLNKIAENFIDDNIVHQDLNRIKINRTAYGGLDSSIRYRVVIQILSRLSMTLSLSSKNIDGIYKLAMSQNPSAYTKIDDLIIRCEYDKLVFDHVCDIESCKDEVECIKAQVYTENDIREACLETIPIVICEEDELYWRKRQSGDFIRLKNGKKKLKKFLIDMKIPKEERESIAFLTRKNEIIYFKHSHTEYFGYGYNAYDMHKKIMYIEKL